MINCYSYCQCNDAVHPCTTQTEPKCNNVESKFLRQIGEECPGDTVATYYIYFFKSMYANENCHGKLRPRRAANEAFPKHGESREKSQQTKKPAKKHTPIVGTGASGSCFVPVNSRKKVRLRLPVRTQ